MSLPMIAIVGRPNVGKSSLLNCIARRMIGIVDPTPGVTRDRVSAVCNVDDAYFELVDTGGFGIEDHDDRPFTILCYAAEASDRVGRWLEAIAFRGGDRVEAGARMADYFANAVATEHDRAAIAPDARYQSRPAAEVLACVHQSVQRQFTSR